MKIQQLIDEQMHRFEYLYLIESKDKRKFADLANDNSYISIFNYAKSIKSFVSKDYTRKLIEALGEELINTKFKCGWKHDEEGVEYDLCDECRAVEEHKDEQRLKLKEIISSLK